MRLLSEDSEDEHISSIRSLGVMAFNPLNSELNPIFHLLALLGAHPFLHISGLRVKIK
jgi:hypothetical protein